MGLLVWHSHFVSKFSEKMLPISKLIQKDEPFKWGEEQQNALDTFKRIITTSLKIYFPDYELPIYIACDSSGSSLGACLYQVRTFKKNIQSFDTTEKHTTQCPHENPYCLSKSVSVDSSRRTSPSKFSSASAVVSADVAWRGPVDTTACHTKSASPSWLTAPQLGTLKS